MLMTERSTSKTFMASTLVQLHSPYIFNGLFYWFIYLINNLLNVYCASGIFLESEDTVGKNIDDSLYLCVGCNFLGFKGYTYSFTKDTIHIDLNMYIILCGGLSK